jgi:hypothetical protein
MTSTNPNPSIVSKIRIAFSRRNALATVLGIFHGAPIPVGVFSIMHIEMENQVWQWKGLIVLAGLLYSAKTVYKWGKQVFRGEDGSPDTIKALGFVGMIEGMMVVSNMMWLNIVGLVILILINAIAGGVSMAMDAEKEIQPVDVAPAVAAVEIEPAPVTVTKRRAGRPAGAKDKKPRKSRKIQAVVAENIN